eukprot:6089935-Prorocentrum_lima.AAC.1
MVLPTHADTKSLGVQLPKLKQTYGYFIGFDTEIPMEVADDAETAELSTILLAPCAAAVALRCAEI